MNVIAITYTLITTSLFLFKCISLIVLIGAFQAAEELADLVAAKFGAAVDAIHGQRRQEQRELSLRNFRQGHTRALSLRDKHIASFIM